MHLRLIFCIVYFAGNGHGHRKNVTPALPPGPFDFSSKNAADMAKALTQMAIENQKSDPDKRLELPDPGLSGLYLAMQPSGAKSWAMRYRFGGKTSKLTLGAWPIMGLAEASGAANAALLKIEAGTSPNAEKPTAKTAQVKAQLLQRDKIKTLVAEFDKRHLSQLKSGKAALGYLKRSIVPAWGDLEIQTITKRDVIDLLDRIVDTGRVKNAYRTLAYMRGFFN